MEEKEFKQILDKRDYLIYKIERFGDLIHRSECPCCENKIDFEKDYKPRIELYKKELEEISPIIDKEVNQRIVKSREKNNKEQVERHIFETKAEKFYEQHKTDFNTAIKQAKKLDVVILPKFNKEEKKLWNCAMEYIALDKPSLEDLEDFEELYYKI